MNNKININPSQVQGAAQAGLKLLTDDERVNVPPSMAANGMYTLLVNILGALGSGEAVLANPEPQMSPEIAGAVKEAISGNGAQNEEIPPKPTE